MTASGVMSGVLLEQDIHGGVEPRDDVVVHLKLLGSFELRYRRQPIKMPLNVQRLVAFLALHDRPLLRSYVAGSLWPDVSEERAAGNLRSSVWRLRQAQIEIVDVSDTHLRLSSGVAVDLRAATSTARRLMDPREQFDVLGNDEMTLSADVLPDWYEEWVFAERERFRQLRLYALQVMCERLAGVGRLPEAVQAGLAAVAAEPLRESAQRALIRTHLAEGNVAEAVRQYRSYEELLSHELGIKPSPLMRELVAGLTED